MHHVRRWHCPVLETLSWISAIVMVLVWQITMTETAADHQVATEVIGIHILVAKVTTLLLVQKSYIMFLVAIFVCYFLLSSLVC